MYQTYIIHIKRLLFLNELLIFIPNNSAALSDEDKEKIEKLRSSAILRHLNMYSMVSKLAMFKLLSL